MATFLADIHSYWAGNASLNAKVPSERVYTGMVPESISLPWVAIVPTGSTPTFTCGTPYFEGFQFEIQIYSASDSECEAIVRTVKAEFDYATLSSACVSCERLNYIFTTETTPNPDRQGKIFSGRVEYLYNKNRNLT